MKIVIYVDAVIACYVIEATEWAAFNQRDPTEMIISLSTFVVLTEIDDMCSSWYIKFFVMTNEEGEKLYKLGDDFWNYDELNMDHLRAVAYWNHILLYMVVWKQVLNVL